MVESFIALFVVLCVPTLAIVARRDVAAKVAKNLWREITGGGLDERARQIASRTHKRDFYS